MNLTFKEVPSMSKCVELFFSTWFGYSLTEQANSFFKTALSFFLTQFAFNQRFLPEITQCALYFRQILNYYRLPSSFLLKVEETAVKKAHTEQGKQEVLPGSNCITETANKKLVINKSILNLFLNAVASTLPSIQSMEAVDTAIQCILDIGFS